MKIIDKILLREEKIQDATMRMLAEYLTPCKSLKRSIEIFLTAVVLTMPLAIKSYSDYKRDVLRYENGEIRERPNIENYHPLSYSKRHKSFPNKSTTNCGNINVVDYI